MFTLPYMEFKECSCGKVVGGYLNNSEAVVNGEGASVAIGHGAFGKALNKVRIAENEDVKLKREDYIHIGMIPHAWVRPHDGPGNPHTHILPELLTDMDCVAVAAVVKKRKTLLVKPGTKLGMKNGKAV